MLMKEKDGQGKVEDLNFSIDESTKFSNYTFNQNIAIKCELEDIIEIEFSNCIFQNYLNVEEVFNVKNVKITFYNTIFEVEKEGRNVSLLLNRNVNRASFYNCFIKSLIIEDCKTEEVKLYNTLCENLYIIKSNNIEKINLSYNWKDINFIQNNKNLEYFNLFFENEKKSDYRITNCFKEFKIDYHVYNQEEIPSIFFNTYNPDVLKKLNLWIIFESNENENNEKIHLNNIVARSIVFKGNFNNIDLNNCKTSRFVLSNYSVKKAMISKLVASSNYFSKTNQQNRDDSTNNINEKELIFDISKSNLSNTIFWNAEIDSFEIVNIYQSFLENCTFAMVKFPEKISTTENIFNNMWKGIPVDYHEEYEIYRQLFNLFNKNGDIVNALKMRSNQMNALLNLKKKNKIKNVKSNCLVRKLKKLKCVLIKWIQKLDRETILLYINKYSNNFGNSSTRAFLFIIVFSILFTSLYLYSFGYVIDLSKEGSVIYSEYLFSVILNPFSNNKSILENGGKPTFFSYPILFLSKIVISFLYYQFVAAYRRFGKSDK